MDKIVGEKSGSHRRISGFQIFLVTLVALAWALCFPLIELGHRAAPPLRFAAIRSLVAGLSIIVPLLFFNRTPFSNIRVWKYSFYVAMTYTVVGFGGMFLADGRVPSGISTVLANMQPLLAAILAYFFLNERLSKKNILGLVVSFFGIMVLASKTLFSTAINDGLVGILFILMGALGTGAGNVFMKKSSKVCDPISLTGLQFLIGFTILYSISHVYESHIAIDWHPSFFWSLVVLAIPGTSLATIVWIFLLKKVQLSTLNVFTFLTPVFGLIIGLIFFNEKYSYIELLGVTLTLIGIYFATLTSAVKST